MGSLNLVLVPTESESEMRTWMPGVYLGSDPRKTNEEVGKVRQGGEESQ